MDVILKIEGGPMDGQKFKAEFGSWPPPDRLLGQDIHRTLCGLYERRGVAENNNPASKPLAVYRLREDDDYHRIKRVWDRHLVMQRLAGEGIG